MEERLAKLESDLNYQIEDLGAKKQETERNFERKALKRELAAVNRREIQRSVCSKVGLEYKLSQFSSLADQNQKLLSGYNRPVSGDTAQGNTGSKLIRIQLQGLDSLRISKALQMMLPSLQKQARLNNLRVRICTTHQKKCLMKANLRNQEPVFSS